MKKQDEFFVPYISESLGSKTKKTIRRLVWTILFAIIVIAGVFAFTQKPFKNGSFELTSETRLTGVFHENPYPMLRVKVADDSYKNILLLGFGKSSVNPYLAVIRKDFETLTGKELAIEGNLIYYNGKTLVQITSEEKIKVMGNSDPNILPQKEKVGKVTLTGEIIDPKCYFGVMKPGYGKIHRSCAVRCISGGIPPVLAATDSEQNLHYYLITDLNGGAIHESILPFVGKPAEITGIVETFEDWQFLRINVEDIRETGEASLIY